jgi:hypothetical protein
MVLNNLLEEVENQLVRYYCMVSEGHRYDIVVIHSEKLFGKVMVVSIQNGRMVLLNHNDIPDEHYWVGKLDINREDVNEFRNFLYMVLDKVQLSEQF